MDLLSSIRCSAKEAASLYQNLKGGRFYLVKGLFGVLSPCVSCDTFLIILGILLTGKVEHVLIK